MLAERGLLVCRDRWVYARAMADRDPLETDDAVVLVLGAPGGKDPQGHLEGVTRLEKLIFLLERETPVREWMTDKADFRSYKFGPFSSKVYEAVDMPIAVGSAHWVGDTAHDLLIRAEPRK